MFCLLILSNQHYEITQKQCGIDKFSLTDVIFGKDSPPGGTLLLRRLQDSVEMWREPLNFPFLTSCETNLSDL